MACIGFAGIDGDDQVRRDTRGKQGAKRGVHRNYQGRVLRIPQCRQRIVERGARAHEDGRHARRNVIERRDVTFRRKRRKIGQGVQQIGRAVFAPRVGVGFRVELEPAHEGVRAGHLFGSYPGQHRIDEHRRLHGAVAED